ncbi:MAG: bifunctional lysylphosphatidylglycerol flippase/synthetase MprF [Sphingomonas bacterium]|nr:bifunctional lysylphosphatidylglycerol flippase/synthetase MprF [Sphingomonas bacterium]
MTGFARRAVDVAKRYRHIVIILAVAAVAGIAFAALHATLAEVHLKQVRHALAAVPGWRIAAALGLTMLSYLALTGYDHVALAAVGKPLPWRASAVGSFTSYTLSHNLGLAMLTGGSARYRVYSAAGLDLAEVAQVSVLTGITFWAGVIGIAGLALVTTPAAVPTGPLLLSPLTLRLIGIALITAVAALPIARLLGRDAIGWGRVRLPIPTLGQQARLALVSLVDLIAAAAVLFVLIPGVSLDLFPGFFAAYAAALLIALMTHVPGGLGVFESIMLGLVPVARPELFAALLLYRLAYYLLPLAISGVGVGIAEGHRLRKPIGRGLGKGLGIADRVGQTLAPTAVTLLVFLAGFVLLVSGALPGVKSRLSDIDALLPLPFIEGSHLAGSLIGTALLLVAPALGARLRRGFEVARLLLIGGAIFSLLKGFDYEEAMLQLIVLAVLQYARPGFYRRGGLLREPLDLRWIAAAAAAIALSVWAGFFAYKRVAFTDELWWRFALDANAPRFLRASFAAGVLLTATAFWQLMRGQPVQRIGGTLDPAIAAAAFAETSRTDALLAYTGDKSFLTSAAGDAFLMYRVQGHSWIVMGDPVGPLAAWAELIWAIRHAADKAGGRLCLFQTSAAMLPLIVDLGLDAIKYGEEAQVALADFTLAGPKAKGLRHALRRCDEAGLSFNIVPAADIPVILDDLRRVSDAWLADKGGEEKRFSLGAFDPDYFARFDIAVVRDAAGGIVAFANIWVLPDRVELSVDLMRHVPDMPYGTMDMMFVRLFEWGRDHGYRRFNMGMAPLSGLPAGRLAPLWAKLGRALFHNGEALYGFAGLRTFKGKFAPQWQPRYIATPRRLGQARALIDLVRLVSA